MLRKKLLFMAVLLLFVGSVVGCGGPSEKGSIEWILNSLFSFDSTGGADIGAFSASSISSSKIKASGIASSIKVLVEETIWGDPDPTTGWYSVEVDSNGVVATVRMRYLKAGDDPITVGMEDIAFSGELAQMTKTEISIEGSAENQDITSYSLFMTMDTSKLGSDGEMKITYSMDGEGKVEEKDVTFEADLDMTMTVDMVTFEFVTTGSMSGTITTEGFLSTDVYTFSIVYNDDGSADGTLTHGSEIVTVHLNIDGTGHYVYKGVEYPMEKVNL